MNHASPANILAAIASACQTPANADEPGPPTLQAAIGNPDNFKVSGSVRVRYEALDGRP